MPTGIVTKKNTLCCEFVLIGYFLLCSLSQYMRMMMITPYIHLMGIILYFLVRGFCLSVCIQFKSGSPTTVHWVKSSSLLNVLQYFEYSFYGLCVCVCVCIPSYSSPRFQILFFLWFFVLFFVSKSTFFCLFKPKSQSNKSFELPATAVDLFLFSFWFFGFGF